MALFRRSTSSSSQSQAAKGMDVLCKYKLVPATLRSCALEAAAGMVLQELFRRQGPAGSSLAVKGAMIACAEETLRAWLDGLPVGIREDLLELALRRLAATMTGRLEQVAGAAILPVLVSACMEVLYSPHFRRLRLSPHLQWHRDSRMRVLHLLHSRGEAASLRHLSLDCYDAQVFRFEPPHFSEMFVLASCFNRLGHLSSLRLPNVCQDEILACAAANCPALEEVDVAGSFAVTDRGVRWMLGTDPVPKQKMSFQEAPSRNLGSRVGFKPAPFLQCQMRQDGAPLTLKQPPRLTSINLEGTSVTKCGVESILGACADTLSSVRLDPALWDSFLEALGDEEDAGVCAECVGRCWKVADASGCSVKKAEHLMNLQLVFPSLKHLTLEGLKENAKEDIGEILGGFQELNSLTVKNMSSISVFNYLQDESVGVRMTTLCFSGKTASLDCALLNATCPNLERLSVTDAKLVLEPSTTMSAFMPRLTSLRLWETRSLAGWKELLKRCQRLRSLYVWNVVLTDADVEELFADNDMAELEDVRIGSSEIGFLRLTEDTASRFIRTCPRLRALGGVCDWNVRDLLTLLHGLLLSGGWRISLE